MTSKGDLGDSSWAEEQGFPAQGHEILQPVIEEPTPVSPQGGPVTQPVPCWGPMGAGAGCVPPRSRQPLAQLIHPSHPFPVRLSPTRQT